MDHHSAPPSHGRQAQRHSASHPHPLDRLLSLGQRPGIDSGGYVQRFAGTERSLPESVHSPAHSTLGFLPAHMEALIDLRNLLAQGYVPVMGQDGQTVYLFSLHAQCAAA